MSDTLVLERIESNPSRLRLPRIKEILQGMNLSLGMKLDNWQDPTKALAGEGDQEPK